MVETGKDDVGAKFRGLQGRIFGDRIEGENRIAKLHFDGFATVVGDNHGCNTSKYKRFWHIDKKHSVCYHSRRGMQHMRTTEHPFNNITKENDMKILIVDSNIDMTMVLCE